MINLEKRYPIYQIHATWSQDDLDYNNGSGYSRMYQEDPGFYGALEDGKEWWEDYIRKPYGFKIKEGPSLLDKNVQLVNLDCKFLGYETWCLAWFSHYTNNIHLTDEELLKSFENFVRRKEPLDRNLRLPKEHQDPNLGTYCLMGAEDRWRWKGPCRCKDCVKVKITRIDH